MATRRSEKAIFDHGAQFYVTPNEHSPCHSRWVAANLVTTEPNDFSPPRSWALQGMTRLAKNLALDLPLHLQKKVTKLSWEKQTWTVHCEEGVTFDGEEVVLTAPLPQSLEILKSSEISFAPELEEIRYTKALVLLVEGELTFQGASLPTFSEFSEGDISTIVDQQAKGVSPTAAWTLVMSPTFSETHFEKSESEILDLALQALQRKGLVISSPPVLKKWRYSIPLQRYPEPFYSPVTGLYLAGDAFGGPHISGALFSAESLLKHFRG